MTPGACPPGLVPELVDVARGLATAAGDIARRHFRQKVAVDTKADDSPVTIADREIEAFIREGLARQRPGDGIIGEEYGIERSEAELVWVIDPIDGTRAFITGRPSFGTLIACLAGDTPVLGVIYQPIVGDLWVGATGQPTTHNGTAVTTRACPKLAQARIGTTSPATMNDGEKAAFTKLSAGALDTIYGGDCYNYGLVASGFLDVAVDCSMQIYDYAALVPVVEGAGGRMVQWSGAPLGRSGGPRVLAVGDPALLAEALRLVAG
ncbi:MAG: inositol monophosphatase family protein [Rhodospirillaceae bacterium]|nr:inositol monophosphatase family protein [Rhodospirillaceae bacterium]